jgi:hypothetical protein
MAFLQHAGCGESRLLPPGHPIAPGRTTSATSLCIVRNDPYPHGLILCSSLNQIVRIAKPTWEPISLELSLALSDGFELVLGSPLEVTAPPVSGWHVDISERAATLEVVSRQAGMGPYIGQLPESGIREWLEVIHKEAACVVMLGTGLILEADSLLDQLDRLVSDARLVVGALQVRWLDDLGT